MFERLRKEIREAVGFTISSVLIVVLLSLLPVLAMLFLQGKEWSPVLLVFGSGLLAVAFHFTSAGNAAFSVAVPRNDRKMYDKAHEISYGAGIMATAGASLIALGIMANWIVKWTTVPYRVAFIVTTLLATVSFFQGLKHVRDQLPWAKVVDTENARDVAPEGAAVDEASGGGVSESARR